MFVTPQNHHISLCNCLCLKHSKCLSSFTEKLEEKQQYLMAKVVQQLQSNPSPIQKLDLFISLEEARALDSLKDYTTSLDFSNTPMTALYLNILISVMKHLDKLELLSLAGCGIDDALLDVFATWTRGDIAQVSRSICRSRLC